MVVLPDEPVSPITVSPGSRSTTARASRPSAASGSSTTIVGHARRPGCRAPPPHRRRPRRRRSRARRPARRRRRRRAPPGPTLRESNSTGPVTGRRRVGVDQPAADRPRRSRPGSAGSPVTPPGRRSGRVSAAASSIRSSNGSTSPATSWPRSWPLPSTATTSPGPASRTASSIAARRPGHLDDLRGAAGPRRPRRSTAARIAAGSSVRGLSSVTTHHVGAPGGGRAHQRPLAAVPVAAGADARRSAGRRGCRPARAARPAPRRSRRACARSRRRRAPSPGAVDAFQPARHAGAGGDAVGGDRRVDPDGDQRGEGQQRVGDVVPAGQRHPGGRRSGRPGRAR